MPRNYIAYCKCGGVVAIAVANTIEEVTDHAKDAKKWAKQGFRVELKEHAEGGPMPEWCRNPSRAGTCKGPVVTEPGLFPAPHVPPVKSEGVSS